MPGGQEPHISYFCLKLFPERGNPQGLSSGRVRVRVCVFMHVYAGVYSASPACVLG